MRYLTLILLLCGMTCPVHATDLEVAFAGTTWDGVTVPEGSQCQKFGGGGDSPALVVNALPAAADAVVIEFSDRSYAPMDKGGHGKVGYGIAPGSTTVTVPAIPAHTSTLPEGFWIVAEHGAPGWDTAGAYLPPCSGGRGNAYYLTVRAIRRAAPDATDGETLAEGSLELGRY